MAALRHKLQKDVFLPTDERLIGFVYVTKDGKKEKKKQKESFLCATITTEQPVQVTIYIVKKTEKETFKRKSAWPIRSLRIVDGRDSTKDIADFNLQFDKTYHFCASNPQEKKSFLSVLYKLSDRYLQNKKPQFLNVSKEVTEGDFGVSGNECTGLTPSPSTGLLEGGGSVEQQLSSATILANSLGLGPAGFALTGGGSAGRKHPAAGDDDGDEDIGALPPGQYEDYHALTGKEEVDLDRLMREAGYCVADADRFRTQLREQLSLLDGANIQSIMSSEQQVSTLMTMLEKALSEIDILDERLDKYDEMFEYVREHVESMEEQGNMTQVLNTSHVKLADEMDAFIVRNGQRRADGTH